jgi:hypothetical protein
MRKGKGIWLTSALTALSLVCVPGVASDKTNKPVGRSLGPREAIQAVRASSRGAFLTTATSHDPRRTRFLEVTETSEEEIGVIEGMTAGRLVAVRKGQGSTQVMVGGGADFGGDAHYVYRVLELSKGSARTVWSSTDLLIPPSEEPTVSCDDELRWWAAARVVVESGREAGLDVMVGDLPSARPRYQARIRKVQGEPPGPPLALHARFDGSHAVLPLDRNSVAALYGGRVFLLSGEGSNEPTTLLPARRTGHLLTYHTPSDSLWVSELEGEAISVFFLAKHRPARDGRVTHEADAVVGLPILGFLPGPILGVTDQGLAIAERAPTAGRAVLLQVAASGQVTVVRKLHLPPFARAWIGHDGSQAVFETPARTFGITGLGSQPD